MRGLGSMEEFCLPDSAQPLLGAGQAARLRLLLPIARDYWISRTTLPCILPSDCRCTTQLSNRDAANGLAMWCVSCVVCCACFTSFIQDREKCAICVLQVCKVHFAVTGVQGREEICWIRGGSSRASDEEAAGSSGMSYDA